MPGTPQPITEAAFGNATPIAQAQRRHSQGLRNAAGQAQQGNIFDQYMNTIEVSGANLNQIVTIGASFQSGGVQVSTGLPNGTPGRAVQQNLAVGTITLTEGSTSATLGPSPSGTFATGMVIGAADDSDLSQGSPPPAIVPGTYIESISGMSIALSQAAAEDGSGIACAACNFVQAEPGEWSTLTVPSGFSVVSGYYPPAARLVTGDSVGLRGIMQNTSGGTRSGTLLKLPTAMQPASSIYFPGGLLTVEGSLTSFPGWIAASSIANDGYVALDSLTFTLF